MASPPLILYYTIRLSSPGDRSLNKAVIFFGYFGLGKRTVFFELHVVAVVEFPFFLLVSTFTICLIPVAGHGVRALVFQIHCDATVKACEITNTDVRA